MTDLPFDPSDVRVTRTNDVPAWLHNGFQVTAREDGGTTEVVSAVVGDGSAAIGWLCLFELMRSTGASVLLTLFLRDDGSLHCALCVAESVRTLALATSTDIYIYIHTDQTNVCLLFDPL